MPSPSVYCGLDFGTSNSTFGAADAGGDARLVPLEGESVTIPSTIFFDFETDRTLVGRAAVAAYVEGADGRMMRSLKSVLGSSLIEEATRVKRELIPFLDILGLFLRALKARAETEIGETVEQVVVGRPVQFVDDDQGADRLAEERLEATVRGLGIRHVEFQYEPIAAALDYERQVSGEELGLVIDLGGGTSDFSIVRVSPERRRHADRADDILATAGVHIGGTDFDRMLSLAKVMPQLGYQTPTEDGKRPLPSGPYYDLATWHRINRLYAPEVMRELRSTMREARDGWRVDKMISIVAHREGHALAGAVEDAKIALTGAAAGDIRFDGEEVELVVPVTRAELAEALDAAIGGIAATIAETLRRAELGAGRIDTLIMTGGSTQIPAIQRRLRELFPAARAVSTDAFGSVGLGLALDARRKFG